MRSKRVLRKRSLPRWDRLASPVLFGFAAWLAFPSVPSQGDLTDMLSGVNGPSESWRMVITQSPAGSLHTASLAFPGGSHVLGGDAGIALPDGRRVALADKDKTGEGTPDEDRINRSEKKGRIVAVMPMLPPKAFSAGSILDRSSSLTKPVDDEDEMTAFVKVARGEQASQQPVEVAEFYFRKDEVKEKSLPPMIASLVTNDHADILATAYASSAPDFSRQSPFDAILKKPEAGRFIPPIGPEDHAWAANPLPADSFSPKQQQCLASGIYFEARGESVRGQAAVAQVILNRVRNPAYPDTICDVVYQNEDWRNRCQFSFACDGQSNLPQIDRAWETALTVTTLALANDSKPRSVAAATHYHADYVDPYWSKSMHRLTKIGRHIFYSQG